MVKISKLAIVFWVGLWLALVIVIIMLWFPGVLLAFGFDIAAKSLWKVLAVDLSVVAVVSPSLVKFRDEGKIPTLNDLRKRNVLVKASISPVYKLTTIVDPETGESLIITGVPENLPNTFMIENDGKVKDLTK